MLWHILPFKVFFTRSSICVVLSALSMANPNSSVSYKSPFIERDNATHISPKSFVKLRSFGFVLKHGCLTMTIFPLRLSPKIWPKRCPKLRLTWQPIAWSQITGLKMPLVVSNLKRSSCINKGWWRGSKICKETYSLFSSNPNSCSVAIHFEIYSEQHWHKFNSETFRCMKFKPWQNWSSRLVEKRLRELSSLSLLMIETHVCVH